MKKEDIINKMNHLEETYADEETDRLYKALPESRYEAIADFIMEHFESKTCENCKSLSWCDIWKLVEDDCEPNDFYCKDFQQKRSEK